MRTLGFGGYALSVGTAVAVFAGCSGAQQSRGAFDLGDAASMRTGGLAAGHLIATHDSSAQPAVSQRHKEAWISPDIRRIKSLLFVSDPGANAIDIFALPTLRLKGQVTGFDFPEGECSDQSGNIWVTDEFVQQIIELSRLGEVIRTLSDPAGYPVSCSVDRTSGNLAVTNKVDLGSAPGQVEIYVGASGIPDPISNPHQTLYFFDGYDNSGNLFVDGFTAGSPPIFVLSECLAGHQDCSTVKVKGAQIYYPGMVQVYASSGHYLVVGDQECHRGSGPPHTCLYRVSISGSTGEVVDKISLDNYDAGAVCDVGQGVIYGSHDKYLAGTDNEYLCGSTSTVNRWPFSNGGIPINYSTDGGALSYPVGAAVSIAK